jgi:hypothetical protein
MRLPDHAHRIIPLFVAIVVAGLLVSARVAFADDGDEKCSKKGELWVYDGSSRSWENTMGACVPRGASGPVNGDRKCGVSGFTVKYVAKIDTWQNMQGHCSGASTSGAHLENLHSGTQQASPSGQNDVGAPGVP